MVSGPITLDATTWVVGLMQIRIGASATNIATATPVLTAADSIGAMAETAIRGQTEFFKQMSGFPKQEDGTIPISETFAIECAFKEITPFNMALARGLDPIADTPDYDDEHNGTIALGGLVAPLDIRVEAVYTFPDGTNFFTVVLPRGQAVASTEVAHAEESEASVPIVFESKNASSDNTAGDAAWDDMPLGAIIWDDGVP
jgi:hypothetical protein